MTMTDHQIKESMQLLEELHIVKTLVGWGMPVNNFTAHNISPITNRYDRIRGNIKNYAKHLMPSGTIAADNDRIRVSLPTSQLSRVIRVARGLGGREIAETLDRCTTTKRILDAARGALGAAGSIYVEDTGGDTVRLEIDVRDGNLQLNPHLFVIRCIGSLRSLISAAEEFASRFKSFDDAIGFAEEERRAEERIRCAARFTEHRGFLTDLFGEVTDADFNAAKVEIPAVPTIAQVLATVEETVEIDGMEIRRAGAAEEPHAPNAEQQRLNDILRGMGINV